MFMAPNDGRAAHNRWWWGRGGGVAGEVERWELHGPSFVPSGWTFFLSSISWDKSEYQLAMGLMSVGHGSERSYNLRPNQGNWY